MPPFTKSMSSGHEACSSYAVSNLQKAIQQLTINIMRYGKGQMWPLTKRRHKAFSNKQRQPTRTSGTA